MNNPSVSPSCDCCSEISRRQFLKTSTLAVGAAAASALPGARLITRAEETKAKSETLVTSLYKTLTEEQRKAVCFGFDHPLRSKVDNNWQITNKTVTDFFNKDQQEMVRQIFLGLHSPEYAERV